MNTKPPRERESKVQRAIIVQAKRWLGLELYRRNTGAMSGEHNGKRWHVRFAAPGQSDLWGVIPRGVWKGRHIEIEVKRKGEKPTDLQLRWLRAQHAAGAIAFWVDEARLAIMALEVVLAGGWIRWDAEGDGCDVVEAPRKEERCSSSAGTATNG